MVKIYIDFLVLCNLLMFSLSAKHDVHVKKEMPSPVKTCSFDEQIKGYFALVYFSRSTSILCMSRCKNNALNNATTNVLESPELC